ncbi:MAG: hypothetical protein M0R74_13870 [Dehalococcoidia bacterium]|nr:hypothetical protein [Dehalococcoidia bacterium]
MEFTEKVIGNIEKRVAGLLREYQTDVDALYDEHGKVKVSMPIELTSKNGNMQVKVGFKLVTGKIDDSSSGFVRDDQPELPLEKADNKFLCPGGKGKIDLSVCDSCELRKSRHVSEPNDAGECLTQYMSCSVWADADYHAFIERMLDWEPAAQTEPEQTKKKGKKAA